MNKRRILSLLMCFTLIICNNIPLTSQSSYVKTHFDNEYESIKMSEILEGNDKYSIETLEVDLFDYEPVAINDTLNSVTSDSNGFHFTGYGITGMESNSGINNSEAQHAKQGILEDRLSDDGLPVVKYLNGEDAGIETGKVLFSDTEYSGDSYGKTIYKDIPFEVIYNSDTGYYEYRSSANHAQVNESKTRIELYADTLSTQNKYIKTLDLSTYTSVSDLTNVQAASSFKATTIDAGTLDRLDPYVLFSVDSIDAESIRQIYVKAKVPESIGENKFQLFFITDQSTGWEEAKSFGNPDYSEEIEYEANGEYIEFVIDTSENANWKDKITSIRIDLFDSKNGNIDVNGAYNIEIEQISLIGNESDEYATRGGFYPFSDIAKSYPGNSTTPFNMNDWEKLMNKSGLTTSIASRSIFNPSPVETSDLYEHLAYGVAIEFDFYLPVDKTAREDLTWAFNGDDDLWVFVDNQLVLDIGGGHGAIYGEINFTNGEAFVEKAVQVTGYNSGVGAGEAGEESYRSLDESLTEAGKHTMKIFYLERGGSVSNCFIKYNLSKIPDGDVLVEKKVEYEENKPNGEYLFEIAVTPTDDTVQEMQNVSGLNIGTNREVNINFEEINGEYIAEFNLSDDDAILFSGIPEQAIVEVSEIDGYTDVNKECNYIDTLLETTNSDSIDDYSGYGVVVENKQMIFTFINRYEDAVGQLSVAKLLEAYINQEQESIIRIVGVSKDNSDINIRVVLDTTTNLEIQKVIKGLPTGNYEIRSLNDWCWRYGLNTDNNIQVELNTGDDKKVKFEGDCINVKWMDCATHS